MRRNQQRLILMWLGISILGVLTLSPALGQAAGDPVAAGPVTTDWSHQHVIFSRPATVEQSERVQQDPRYWQQLSRQSPKRLPEAEMGGALASGLHRAKATLPGTNQELSRDWSQDLGSGADVGAGNYPAKFSFSGTTANCSGAPQPDFVVYSTGLFGSATQAGIVAFDNLYSGCSGTVPSVYWAYNTVSKILSSPVFSRDGTQVAFVQTNGASQSSLVLLKWAASTLESVGSPMTLTRVLRSLYPACIAPCMTTATLRNGGGTAEKDTHSSVFYDYSNDTAYVGDDVGLLHKFTPVFNGVPAEVKTGGWPVQVNATTPTPLTSPVHDFATGNVFVADTGGFLYEVDSTTAGVTVSSQLDFGVGFVDGPIVDSTAGKVYVFASNDGTTNCASGLGPCSAVYQLTNTFIGGDFGTESEVGDGTVGPGTTPMYDGSFDNAYYKSTGATGNLYVCGNTNGVPTLYQVPMRSGGFGSPAGTSITPLTTTAVNPSCSPVTDVFNPNASGGATEWIYASVQNNGLNSGCAGGGCIFNFEDTAWQASTTYTVGQEVLVLSPFDSKLFTQVVIQAGTSGATPPRWTDTPGRIILNDGSVHWINQGSPTAASLDVWQAGQVFTMADPRIIDSNGNVEVVTSAGGGTTGGSVPVWSLIPGGTTTDNTVTWTNAGVLANFVLPAAGGTSGIIIDNIVGSGTQVGASQVYFSTLSDQICGTSVTPGGCGVQASQPALQ
jgi:hypothetical protein